MRMAIIALGTALAIGPAAAQTSGKWSTPAVGPHLSYHSLEGSIGVPKGSPLPIAVMTGEGTIAKIKPDGEVLVDWPNTEKAATTKVGAFPEVWAIARLMLAIRAGTWKPLAAEK